jgi:outer membrane protein assembly factor BamB
MGLVFGLLPITVFAEEWSSFQSNNENNGYYTGTLTTDFAGTNWDAFYTPGPWACWDSAPVIGNGTGYAVKCTGDIVALNLTTGMKYGAKTQWKTPVILNYVHLHTTEIMIDSM